MVAFFAFAALLVFWVVVIALVKFERGWVGLSPARLSMLRLRVAMDDMTRTVVESLLPAFRSLAAGIARTGEQVALLLDHLPEDIEL